MVNALRPPENQDVSKTPSTVVSFSKAGSASNRVCNFKPAPPDLAAIERGKAAYRRLKGSNIWADWRDVCLALLALMLRAMAAAGAVEPRGGKYQKSIIHQLRLHGFEHIHKTTRSILIDVARNIEAIDAWREELAKSDPERLTDLNHPRVVLTYWKRSLGLDSKNQEASEDRPNPFLTGWGRANADERKAGLIEIGFGSFRPHMPDTWHPEMKAAVARLVAADRDPDHRITDAIQKALEHIVIASNQKTSKAVRLGHEQEALDELRAVLQALRSVKRDIVELDVGLVRPRAIH